MGTIAGKLEYLSGTKDAIKTAIESKGVTVPDGTTFRGYAALIASMPSGGTYQEKTATPTGEQFDVLPDAGYDALSKVTVAGDSALKPWNIPKGTTIYGVVGTAKLAVSTDPPSDLPVTKDDADTVLTENDATADTSTYDLMVLAQDDGNITYCYLAKDTQDSPFVITGYDPITTEFKAKGWRRLSYHTTGEQAGTWTYDDFTDTESGGWNYLKNIRSCSREKLYYKGVEVWPNYPLIWSYNGVLFPAFPERDKETYPYIAISYFSVVYAMSEKCTYTPDTTLESTWPATAPYMTAEIDRYGNITEWKQHDTDGIITFGVFWSNHDVMNTKDGTVNLSASEPIPVGLPIIMYDGEVKTELESWQDPTDSASGNIKLKYGYKIGDTLEITLDGHTETYTATTVDTYNGVLVGNNGLNGNDDGVDDGGDILLTYPRCLNGEWSSYIYTRTAGTHTIKIKLIGVK